MPRILRSTTLVLAVVCGIPLLARGAPPPIEVFAARPRIEHVALSADGRYLAVIQTQDDRGVAVVIDRQNSTRKVVLAEPDDFRLSWCRWATQTRLLCGFSGHATDPNFGVYGASRLVAVDADGGRTKVLVQNSGLAQGQFQDQVLSWRTGIADTVLVQADMGLGESELFTGAEVYGNVGTTALPAVWELNVVADRLRVRQKPQPPIRWWLADSRGNVRLGYGLEDATYSYMARLDGDNKWRRLAKFDAFERGSALIPVAISDTEPDMAYAIGTHEGFDAVWLVDLKDQHNPQLYHAEPGIDVGRPQFGSDDRLIGFGVTREGPAIHYVDRNVQALAADLSKALPGHFVSVQGSTDDGTKALIWASSDVDPGTYYLFDRQAKQLSLVGDPYPALDRAQLQAARPVTYLARDGTPIPGYLTVPKGGSRGLPLVVLPHGGPIARDTLGYDFLRQFLVSRGYAVLQMNFRGSGGYGDAWFSAAHQDWGGLTYDDVVDGVRWAVQEGIADPARMAIVGWSFGGYVALLGAQRDPGLFKCAVSIAGIGDLKMLVDSERWSLIDEIAQKQIGTDRDKLKRDSPRLHAAEIGVPVLLVHGDRDANVPIEQSREMDKALSKAGKSHRLVTIRGAGHSLEHGRDRVTLLRELESFLGQNLGGPAAAK